MCGRRNGAGWFAYQGSRSGIYDGSWIRTVRMRLWSELKKWENRSERRLRLAGTRDVHGFRQLRRKGPGCFGFRFKLGKCNATVSG